MTTPRYPDACVRLVGEDGNIGAIMGRVTHALRRQAKVSNAVCDEFRMQVMACGSYDEALATVMAWVTVEDFEDVPEWFKRGDLAREDESESEALLARISAVEDDNDRLRAEIETLKNERK